MATNEGRWLLSLGGTEKLTTFVTSIKYSSAVSKMLNNITFLYNPNWRFDDYELNTLPIGFFFVKSCNEQSEAEISQKEMLFYNSQNAENPSATSGGLLDVVADNIVVKPKKYRLDVLVPFQPDAIANQFHIDYDTISNVTAFEVSNIFGGGENADVKKTLGTVNQWVSSSVSLIRMLMKALSGSTSMTASGILNLMHTQADINKVSLDAMWQSRGILKMKMWNGWRFKYVAISSIDLNKTGENEEWYEGSIIVQEMPVVTLSSQNTEKKMSALGKAQRGLTNFMSGTLKKSIDWITNMSE